MKVGIVTVTHQSDELRPNGLQLVTRLVNSTADIQYPFECVVVDNASPEPITIPNVDIIRVEDQTIYGLTGGWELGLQHLLSKSCDLIIICNDDLFFNETINTFVEQIEKHPERDKSIYGPLSNGILTGVQRASKPDGIIRELTGREQNMVNGFMFAFTSTFYNTFKKANGDLFNKEKYPWGGNEEEFQRRIWSQGAKSFVIGHCWVSHEKIRGWKQFNR